MQFPPLPAVWPYIPRQGCREADLRQGLTALPGLGEGWQLFAVEDALRHWEAPHILSGVFGRGGLVRSGDYVLRPYRRGGGFRHVNPDCYLSPQRFVAEFRLHRALWLAGFPTVEPLGYAYRKRGWGVQGCFITRFTPAEPWPRQWEKEQGFLQSLDCALAALQLWQVYHPDLNATNVMVTEEREALLLDWDRAAFVSKPPLTKHQARLKRSLIKLNAPDRLIQWAMRAGNENAASPALPDLDALLRGIRREQCQHVRTLAHALRNPLSGIMLQVDLAEDEEDPKQFHGTLCKIRLQASILKNMIAEFTEMSLLDADNLQCKLSTESPLSAIQEVVESLGYALEAKGKTLSVSLKKNVAIRVDFHYFKQALRHLLDFSLLYAREGGELILHMAMESNDALLMLDVPGLTVPDEEMDALFTRFYHPSSRPPGGESHLGIGLFLAKTLVEKMGGALYCVPSAGQLRFTMRFENRYSTALEEACLSNAHL